ncbi:hypothetical protein [Pinisolibacter aquiterrae]|uniref:hypothetical protein n=1 Tax=Pinisolibacter aquiterrae TaxID=2815579 RepID=UPI001C3DA7BE|nr:hypothetical protein [Pinisolibacter aquiterrae]MBV5263926.1 hypothetical protein [Pinisolibacter aquiterrae]MCC8235937.1 hypothetical protein [Pinisolibacter aquiterrae]
MSDPGTARDGDPIGLDPSDLAAAVAAGVVTPTQAEALRAFARKRHALPSATVDEEDVRFVTSFNDIFVTLGIALVTSAIVAFGMESRPLAVAPAVAVLAWALSEIFALRRRMAFPSIVLVGLFVVACGMSVASFLSDHSRVVALASGAAAFVGAYAHWRRFGVPIAMAAMIGGGVAIVLGLIIAASPDVFEANIDLLLLAAGLVVFAFAMRWDASDRQRRTRRTDTAFWLHILAAPLIVHPLAAMIGAGLGTGRIEAPTFVLAMFALLAVVALVVDRRALLVSALIYFGGSILMLLERSGWVGSSSASATIGLVGAVVLLLSIAWAPMRAVVLRFVPARVRALVPAPRHFEGSVT